MTSLPAYQLTDGARLGKAFTVAENIETYHLVHKKVFVMSIKSTV